MAGNKYLTILGSGLQSLIAGTQVSTGVADAGEIVALNSLGLIDNSMLLGGGGQNLFTKVQLITGGDATGSATTIGEYTTIQSALNAIPNGTNSTNVRKVYQVLIPPGTYDEDLTVDITNCHVQLIALGAVNIGLFNNTFWAASNTRNITVNCSANSVNSIRSTFGMGTMLQQGTSATTHPAYSTQFRVSGSILWGTVPSGFADMEMYIAADVFGDIDTSISATNNFHIYLTKARVRGALKGTRNLLQYADWSIIDGLVTCRAYSVIRNCSFPTGMTVSQATGGGFQPFGMVGTNIAGTFTGPALSFVVDGTTSYYFSTLNSGSFAGGASITLLENVSGSSGITQLTGDVTAGPGSGSQAATIAANAVTNAKMATMAANTVKANITAGTAVPTDAALLTTATNNSVAQRTSSGDLVATVMRSASFKPNDGAGTAVTFTSGSAASNAAGGNTTLSSAAGDSTGTGGAGGSLTITGGAANGDGTVDRAGGTVTINGGASKGSSAGGGFTVNLGTGGAGTGTAGATGGTANINAGTGGIGSATSGAGGNATLKAGTGGAGTGGGNGGTASLTGGTGGTGSSTGGNGGAANVSGGTAGSNANATGGSCTVAAGGGSSTGAGGAGGSVTLTGGAAGGDNTQNNNGGSITLTAGTSKGSANGPNVNITAGSGAPGTGTAGSNGGTVAITGGNAGLGSATGGNGGTVTVTGGSSAASPGSAGGAVTVAGATGTSNTTGGAGGNLNLNAGNAGGDNTVNRAGGNIASTAGASKGDSTGGTIAHTCGAGGLGTGATGAVGGAYTLTAGAGGSNGGTSGAGGAITISAGVGGAGGTPGVGGEIIFRTAPTTSITEVFRLKNNGDAVHTTGNILINTLGKGLQIKTGTNSKMGTAVLVAGTVTVSNTSVTANSRIFLTSQSDGGSPGFLRVTAKTNATSFVITSSNAADTSTVAWMIVESIP